MSRSRSLLCSAALAAFAAAPLAGGDSWTSLGPEGGTIYKLSPSSSAPGTVWALSGVGKVFKTTDGAARWTEVPSLKGHQVADILVDPSNASKVFVLSYDGEVLKSVNGGTTWTLADEGLASRISSLRIAPSRPTTLYAAGLLKIFKSTDGGAHWSAVSNLRRAWSLTVSPADPETLFAISQNRVLRSRDGGANWEQIPSLSQRVRQMIFDPHAPRTLYAATSQDGILRSDDLGETWIPLPTPGHSFSVVDWTIDPHSPGTLWVAGSAGDDLGFQMDGIWKSDDRGARWTQVYHGGFGGSPIWAVALDGLGGTLAGVPWTGVLRSADGGLRWDPAHHGMLALTIRELAVAAGGTVWVEGDGEPTHFFSDSLFHSQDSGTTWDKLHVTSYFHVTGIAVSPVDSGTVHVATYGGVYNTTDAGDTWSFSSLGMRQEEMLFGIALAPSQPEILYAGGLGGHACGPDDDCHRFRLYKSVDGGALWNRFRKDLPGGRPFRSLVVHPTRPGTMWAGGAVLLRTTDGGESWEAIGRSLPGSVEDLEIDPWLPDVSYAAVQRNRGGKIFKSTDGGMTWRQAADGLDLSLHVWDLAIDPVHPATLYAATDAGVFVTDDGAAHWRRLKGLKGLESQTVAVDPDDPRTVYAGTNAGLYVLTRGDR